MRCASSICILAFYAEEYFQTTDYAIARRILDSHQRKGTPAERKYTHAQMQRYIMFARCFQPVVR